MAESIKLPLPNHTTESIASEFVERINLQEKEFEKTLLEDEEYSLLVMLHDGSLIEVDKLGYENPDMVIVEGFNEGSQNIKLLMHLHGLQFMLVKYKKIDELPAGNKIGYLQHTKK